MYDKDGGIPALAEVQVFHRRHVRGCFGACSFCALTFHQGRIVSSRSQEIRSARGQVAHARDRGFKGYIHDVGGPTADFRQPGLQRAAANTGACKGRAVPIPHAVQKPRRRTIREYVDILRALRETARGEEGVRALRRPL